MPINCGPLDGPPHSGQRGGGGGRSGFLPNTLISQMKAVVRRGLPRLHYWNPLAVINTRGAVPTHLEAEIDSVIFIYLFFLWVTRVRTGSSNATSATPWHLGKKPLFT